MAKVVWSKQTLEDFENLLDFVATDAPEAACRFGQKLIDRIGVLEQHPHLGALVPEDATGTYRQILQGNCRIIYRVDGDTVYLVALYHAARLLNRDRFDS